MSKSATEQYQIKRKRKRSDNNNNNISNSNNSGGGDNSSSNQHLSGRQRNGDNNNNNNNNSNNNKKNCWPLTVSEIKRCVGHEADVIGALLGMYGNDEEEAAAATEALIADTEAAKLNRDLLAVLCTAKADNRAAMANRRRQSRGNNYGDYQRSRGIKIANDQCFLDDSRQVAGTLYELRPMSPSPQPMLFLAGQLAESASRTRQRRKPMNPAVAAAAPMTPSGAKPTPSDEVRLSYMVGESLVQFGSLPEAFDMYAHIASEQQDGCIPLDRLSTLASGVINYVRQLSSPLSNGEECAGGGGGGGGASDADEEALASSADGPLKTRLKMNFTRQRAAAAAANAWSTTSCLGAAVPNLPGGASLDLFAPSRELRLPSPVLADDYDPLLCPLCRDVLRGPVTTNCGHTFCRQCCEATTQCNICHIKFARCQPDSGSGDNGFYSGDGKASARRAVISTTTSLVTTASMPLTFSGGLLSASGGSRSSISARGAAPLLPRNFNLLATSSSNGHFGGIGGIPTAHGVAAAAATVTTTTVVASTTATATTTMASTSGYNGGAGGGAPSHIKFMPDVLVRRLVEKWWGADLQAKKFNETAASYMHLNLLDDALRYCNASLEKSPTNVKSLLLRAEVLRKMCHYQSSLADVDNALRARYTSAKAHYLRALALSELGRFDEALYDNCLAISLDKSTNLSTSELFQHDLAKILQKLLAQSPKRRGRSSVQQQRAAPYSVLAEHRLRRKQMALLNNVNGDRCSAYGEGDDIDCDDLDGDEFVGACGGKRRPYGLESAALQGRDGDGYELAALRRHVSRKHCRRKWLAREQELLAAPPRQGEEVRSAALFRGILERTQQEVQRLRKLAASGDGQQLAPVPAGLVDVSDFDCVLCCRTFWKPVVTPCGHTYCWVCLDRCMDYTASCPLCMSPLVEPNGSVYQGSSSPVPFVLAKRPVTRFIEEAMKRLIPEQYAKRFRQEMDMEPSVPVFICTTAFPYVPCPLFVYEPRYRLMVRRAVESGEKQFGIVQPNSDKSRYCDVGTILDIRDCVLLGDGCSILSTIGCKRFKILARGEKDGYETAKVEYIYDETIADEHVKLVAGMHAAVLAKAVDWFESLSSDLKKVILQSFGAMPPLEHNWDTIADGPAWAWWIIALLPFSPQLKVNILSTTSLEKRLRAIDKALDRLSGTFRRTQQNCGVGVCQQQQQSQQQQQHQQQDSDEDCDSGAELAPSYANDTDECCLRTSGAYASGDEASHSQLML